MDDDIIWFKDFYRGPGIIVYSGISFYERFWNVKSWIFKDPINKKGSVLVILVPGGIELSRSGIFARKKSVGGHWGHWGFWGCWGHWGCRGFKASKITTEDSRLIQVLELSFISMFLEKKIFGGIMKYQVGFKQLFCLRLLRSANVTFLKTGCKYQNVMTSAIHWTQYIYKIIDPDICQSQITLPISIWDTL